MIYLLSILVYGQNSVSQWLHQDAAYRVVVEAPKATAVRVELVWRLPFDISENAQVYIYHSATGSKVDGVFIREIDSDRLAVAFRAERKGEYHIYYSPSLLREGEQVSVWGEGLKLNNYPNFRALPQAQELAMESALGGNNPYDISATNTQSDYYFSKIKDEFVARLVPAQYPLNTYSRLPQQWLGEIIDKNTKEVKSNFVSKIFQWRATKPIDLVDTVLISPNGKALIQLGLLATKGSQELGVNPVTANDGVQMTNVSPTIEKLSHRELRSWWGVVDISKAMPSEYYNVRIMVKNQSGVQSIIPIVLKVDKSLAQDTFVEDIYKSIANPHSIAKFQPDLGTTPDVRFPVTLSDGYLVSSGDNSLSISTQTSLPAQFFSAGKPLLFTPVLLVFTTQNGIRKIGVNKLSFTRKVGGIHSWQGEIKTHDMHVKLIGSLNAHSLVEYKVEVSPLSNIDFKNISLEFGFANDIDLACYDQQMVAERSIITLRPSQGESSVWVGSKSNGVFVSVPEVEGNILSNSDNSSIKLYKSQNTNLIISSGDIQAKADKPFSLVYRMQLLPSDFAPVERDFKYIYYAQDSLPNLNELGRARTLVLVESHLTHSPENEKLLREIHKTGVDIIVPFDGFSIDRYSPEAAILASMGFESELIHNDRYLKFKYSISLANLLLDRYRSMINKDYVSGVLLSDDPFNSANAELLSHLGREKNTDFVVYLKTSSYDTNTLYAAPWVDKVLMGGIEGTVNFAMQSGVGRLTGVEQRNPYMSLLYRNMPPVLGSDTRHTDVTKLIWSLAQELDLYKGRYFSPLDREAPISSSDKNVGLACYVFADRAVIVLKNKTNSIQEFTLNYHWDRLGVERWQVDSVVVPAVEGLQKEEYLFVNSSFSLDPEQGKILVVKWTKTGNLQTKNR